MKKILLNAVLLFTTLAFSQEQKLLHEKSQLDKFEN